jgi:two-component system response regulator ChvI
MQAENQSRGRVLIVDDDALFREALGQNLAEEGFELVSVDSGIAALDTLSKPMGIQAVLLDWRMPGLDGLEVLHALRERGYIMPVVFLTALSDSTHEEAALAHGAVDFIAKSRSLSVILQRLSLIIEGRRRARAAATGASRRGNLELRPLVGHAFWDGKRVALTLTEFAILQMLAETPKRDISHREIYDLVHGEGFIAGSGEDGYRVNVRSLIKRIRAKFRAVDEEFDCIKSYSGFGYSWDHEE